MKIDKLSLIGFGLAIATIIHQAIKNEKEKEEMIDEAVEKVYERIKDQEENIAIEESK